MGVDKEEAKELVRKYQKEGRDARPRDDRSYGRYGGGRDMDRGQYGGRPPFRSRCKRETHRTTSLVSRKFAKITFTPFVQGVVPTEDLHRQWAEVVAGVAHEEAWIECHPVADSVTAEDGETGICLFPPIILALA